MLGRLQGTAVPGLAPVPECRSAARGTLGGSWGTGGTGWVGARLTSGRGCSGAGMLYARAVPPLPLPLKAPAAGPVGAKLMAGSSGDGRRSPAAPIAQPVALPRGPPCCSSFSISCSLSCCCNCCSVAPARAGAPAAAACPSAGAQPASAVAPCTDGRGCWSAGVAEVTCPPCAAPPPFIKAMASRFRAHTPRMKARL